MKVTVPKYDSRNGWTDVEHKLLYVEYRGGIPHEVVTAFLYQKLRSRIGEKYIGISFRMVEKRTIFDILRVEAAEVWKMELMPTSLQKL